MTHCTHRSTAAELEGSAECPSAATRERPAAYEQPWHRQTLDVPREDRTFFCQPPLHESLELISENHRHFEAHESQFMGMSLPQLRRWAREDVVRAARDYTAEITSTPVAESSVEYLLAAGHQPTLFHPGVWVKNFAIGEIAKRMGATALNLVVDNDLMASARIRIPSGSQSRPEIQKIAFDTDRPSSPWEETHLLDHSLFRTFGDRVVERMAAWGFEPLISDMWPDAVDQMGRSPLLRDCMTAARCRQERHWGLANLELPLSRLCTLEPFLWFACHLLNDLPRFRKIHNRALHEYRVVNRVRSHSHPVPELKENDGWLEAPFWVWREGDSTRHRVFARHEDKEMRLSDGRQTFAQLPWADNASAAVEVLKALPRSGIRFRTRALTTTLFARLCLADLFVHGIGGAKYDEITDRLIARFYGLPVPRFLTMSATLHLPISKSFDARPADALRLSSLLRDLTYNSDRHMSVGVDSRADALAVEKAALIAEQQAARADGLTKRQRRRRSRENHQRFRRFQELNHELSAFTAAERRTAESELASVRTQLEANSVLEDREFAFCLYPADKLRPFVTNLWR